MIINLAKIDFAGGGGSGSGGGLDETSAVVIADALNTLYEYIFDDGGLNDRITTLEEGGNE